MEPLPFFLCLLQKAGEQSTNRKDNLTKARLTVKRPPTNEYPAQHRDPSPKSLHMMSFGV